MNLAHTHTFMYDGDRTLGVARVCVTLLFGDIVRGHASYVNL